MTDKEMAIEYRKSLKQRLIDKDDFERLEMFDENVEEAFIAGLKAGRPKWHKVTDGDLPKEEGEYLVCYETNGGKYRNTFILKYEEYDEGLHWLDEAFETFDEGVIAWCEIPKYTEE